MSVIDLITRVDAICKKYDKYDVDKQKELNVAGDDAFARLYGVFEAEVEAAIQVCLRLCCADDDQVLFNSVTFAESSMPLNLAEIGGGSCREEQSYRGREERGDSAD